MVILQALDTAQTINAYVRDHTGTSYTLTVIDKSLNSSSSSTVTGSTTDGLLTIDVTYNFIEGREYSLKIYRGTELIGFHRIYVTDQTDYDKYSVIDGYYTQPTKTETTYITK